jgi:hypothetical protein
VGLPLTLVKAAVEEEIAPAAAWATRHQWLLRARVDELTLRAATYHPAVSRIVEFRADLDDYPAFPPAWRCVTPGTDESPPSAWPIAGQLAGVSGSIFHPALVLCAPWNRLAYKDQNPNGVHEDWTIASWRTFGGGLTKADHLADMLDQIHLHLAASPGFNG